MQAKNIVDRNEIKRAGLCIRICIRNSPCFHTNAQPGTFYGAKRSVTSLWRKAGDELALSRKKENKQSRSRTDESVSDSTWVIALSDDACRGENIE